MLETSFGFHVDRLKLRCSILVFEKENALLSRNANDRMSDNRNFIHFSFSRHDDKNKGEKQNDKLD